MVVTGTAAKMTDDDDDEQDASAVTAARSLVSVLVSLSLGTMRGGVQRQNKTERGLTFGRGGGRRRGKGNQRSLIPDVTLVTNMVRASLAHVICRDADFLEALCKALWRRGNKGSAREGSRGCLVGRTPCPKPQESVRPRAQARERGSGVTALCAANWQRLQ